MNKLDRRVNKKNKESQIAIIDTSVFIKSVWRTSFLSLKGGSEYQMKEEDKLKKSRGLIYATIFWAKPKRYRQRHRTKRDGKLNAYPWVKQAQSARRANTGPNLANPLNCQPQTGIRYTAARIAPSSSGMITSRGYIVRNEALWGQTLTHGVSTVQITTYGPPSPWAFVILILFYVYRDRSGRPAFDRRYG